MTAKEIIQIADERTLVDLVMALTGGSVNPVTVRKQVQKWKALNDAR